MATENLYTILKDLKFKLEEVLDAARNGSIKHIEALNSYLGAGVNKDVSLQDVCDVFLFHLQGDRVPNNEADTFSRTAKLAFASMAAFDNFELLDEEQDKSFISRVAAAWPALWRWSSYIYSSRIDHVDKTHSARDRAIRVLSTFLNHLSASETIRAQMVQTLPLFEISTKLWLEQDSPHTSRLLSQLLHDLRKDRLDCVLSVINGGATKAAQLCLARVQLASEDPVNVNIASLSYQISLMNQLSINTDHIARYAFLAANSVPIATGILLQNYEYAKISKDRTKFLPLVGCTVLYLRNCLESMDGFIWVAQAISAGLLQALCDWSSLLDDAIGAGFCAFFTDLLTWTIPRYMAFRSVLEPLELALQKIVRGPHKQRIEGSRLARDWRTFCSAAREPLSTLRDARVDLRGDPRKCENAKCTTKSTGSELRRCTGCKTAYYCSKGCQEWGWKEGGHDKVCRLAQKARLEGKSSGISKIDMTFIHYMIKTDVRRRAPALVREALDQQLEESFVTLSVLIDYTAVPTVFKLWGIPGCPSHWATGSQNGSSGDDDLGADTPRRLPYTTICAGVPVSGSQRSLIPTFLKGTLWQIADGAVFDGDEEMAMDLGSFEVGGNGADPEALVSFLANAKLNTKNEGEGEGKGKGKGKGKAKAEAGHQSEEEIAVRSLIASIRKFTAK